MLDTGQQLPASFMDNWLIQLIHVTSTFKTCFQVFWESLDELVLMNFFIYTKTLNNELLDDLGMWKYFCSSLLTFEKKKNFYNKSLMKRNTCFKRISFLLFCFQLFQNLTCIKYGLLPMFLISFIFFNCWKVDDIKMWSQELIYRYSPWSESVSYLAVITQCEVTILLI